MLKLNIHTIISSLFLMVFITTHVHAYDGDVDYSAPYVTIDPETGKLVTIDPKAQTKTPHATPGNQGATASSSSDNTTNPSQTTATSQIQTQSTAQQGGGEESQGTRTTLPILIALLIAGIAAAFIYRGKNKGQKNSPS
jgi:uncharacterized protein YxeA